MTTEQGNAARTLAVSGVLIGLATMLGAFGTHALKPILPEVRFESFQTAVDYQFFHALGLLAVGFAQRAYPQSAGFLWAERLLLVGMLLFCGSIYALTFGAPRFFGMVAPFGGLSLMAAWLVFAVSCWRLRRPPATP
jgi:uncharacterized membrane protein YgdD (TMEM256/DUF423 family)